MKRRTALSCVATMGLLGANKAFAQVMDLNEAINKAGRQRMLSQRTAKAYLAEGKGVLTQRTREVLSGSISLFDRQLAELKAFAPTPAIRATYGDLEAAWGEYKSVLVGKSPHRDSAPLLIELDSKVLALANRGTGQLESVSGRPVARLVNVAGRQRMLSQRVAKFYLAQAWDAAIPSAQVELDKARAEFVAALDVLTNAPEATTSIKQEIELARNQWVFFEAALARRSANGATPEHCANVFLSSENILSVMDKVTGLYARLAA